jgi:hypothetical protein
MHFIEKITTDLEINLPENHKSSEKFILLSVASLHSIDKNQYIVEDVITAVWT